VPLVAPLDARLGAVILADLEEKKTPRFGRGSTRLCLPDDVWTLIAEAACWELEGR
jgi:hypothetical protein